MEAANFSINEIVLAQTIAKNYIFQSLICLECSLLPKALLFLVATLEDYLHFQASVSLKTAFRSWFIIQNILLYDYLKKKKD